MSKQKRNKKEAAKKTKKGLFLELPTCRNSFRRIEADPIPEESTQEIPQPLGEMIPPEDLKPFNRWQQEALMEARGYKRNEYYYFPFLKKGEDEPEWIPIDNSQEIELEQRIQRRQKEITKSMGRELTYDEERLLFWTEGLKGLDFTFVI